MNLTLAQRQLMLDALGNRSDAPKMTGDPMVNAAIDRIVCGGKPWHRLDDEEREMYREEAQLFRNEEGGSIR